MKEESSGSAYNGTYVDLLHMMMRFDAYRVRCVSVPWEG